MTCGEVAGVGAGAAAAQEGPFIASGTGIPAFEYQGFDSVDRVAVGDDGSAYFHQTHTYYDPLEQMTLEGWFIMRRAPGGSWTRIFASGGNPGSSPGYSGMAVHPDGDVWVKTAAGIESFGPTGGDHVVRTAPDNGWGDIAIDADGNVWFTSNTDRIGRVDPSGTTTHFSAAVNTRPGRIAVDDDGNAWFTSSGTSRIGRITPAGTITMFADPNALISNSHIATDAAGNAWFTSPANDRVGRVTPAGVVTTYTDPAGDLDDPRGITRGPGGVMYVASRRSNRIGVVDGSGGITSFTDPVGAVDDPTEVAWGGDAEELWVIGGERLYRLSEAAVPGAVRALRSSQGYREVRVWWNKPTSPGGLPVTYRVRRDGAVLGTTNERWWTDSGLVPGQRHQYEVTAVSLAGDSPAETITAAAGLAGYTVFSATDQVDRVAAGPDGNLWFTRLNDDRIGRMTPAGEVTMFTDPQDQIDKPWGIAAGPDGNVWFTSYNNDRLGRITPGGAITTFADPSGQVDQPLSLVAGPDGNVWFANGSTNPARIGRITPSGVITTYEDPGDQASYPVYVTAGPDGNVWFTTVGTGGSRIGRITPAGAIAYFTGARPSGRIVAGPDGNLWVPTLTPEGVPNQISRVTPLGVVTHFPDPVGDGAEFNDVVTGPDGRLYVGTRIPLAPYSYRNVFIVVDPATGHMVRLDPTIDWGVGLSVRPSSLVAAHGAIWFVGGLVSQGEGRHITRLSEPRAPRTPTGLSVADGPGTTAMVSWTKPADAGTGPITSYAVTRDGSPVATIPANASPLQYTDPSVTDGVTYSYTVAAVNEVGAGPAAEVGFTPGDTSAHVAGTITDEVSGDLVVDARVFAVATDGTLAATAATDTNGDFQLDVAAGTYRVQALDVTGRHTGEWFDDTDLGDYAGADPVTVTAANTQTADFTLAPTGPSAAIAGTITETGTGTPIAGTWVIAIATANGTIVAADTTDSAGDYRIDGLRTGDHRLAIIDPTLDHDYEFHHDAPSFFTATDIATTAGHTTTIDEALTG